MLSMPGMQILRKICITGIDYMYFLPALIDFETVIILFVINQLGSARAQIKAEALYLLYMFLALISME